MDTESFLNGFISGLEKTSGAVSDVMPRGHTTKGGWSDQSAWARSAVGRSLRHLKGEVKPKEFRKQHGKVAKIVKKIKSRGGSISGIWESRLTGKKPALNIAETRPASRFHHSTKG